MKSSRRLLACLLACACTAAPQVEPAHAPPRPDAAAGSPADAMSGGPGFALPDAGPREAGAGPSMPAVPQGPSTEPWGGQLVDPRLPATAPMSFSGKESPAGGPRVVYPLDGSLHPTNLADITIQWQRGGAGQSLYRLRFQNERGTFDIFTPCAEPECIYPVPDDTWAKIAGTNRDRDVRLTVTAAGTGGGTDAASAPVNMRFSPGRVEGGLYYWSTSLQGTYRLSLGQKKAVPFITPGQGGCYGCHAVSRNGKRIAWTDMSPTGLLTKFRPETLLSAPTETPDQRSGGRSVPSSTLTLNPDGTRVLVSEGSGALSLRDAATTALVATVDPAFVGQGKAAFFPEWSPDGTRIAVSLGTSIPANGTGIGFNLADAEIAVLPYNDGKFGPATVLVARDKDIHFYPTWSPDGKWLAFCSAPAGAGMGPTVQGTYNNPQARLRLVAATGGMVFELGRATQGVGATASWPKFTPFSQLGGQLFFLTYSSKVDYGFLMRGKARPQLWLAAVDLRRLGEGDPSWAPVWLPFQEVNQNNHLPFWTEALGCTQNAECGEGAMCKERSCVPNYIP
jgi:hypothetical protein